MKITTLHWNTIKPTYLSISEYNRQVKYLEHLEYKGSIKKINNCLFSKNRYFINTYQLIHRKSNDGTEIRQWIEGDGAKRYIFCKNVTNTALQTHQGRDCFYQLNTKYKGLSGDNRSIIYRFSGNRFENEYFDIKKCVPIQINYAKRSSSIQDCGYKADVSACFSSEVKFGLPTLHKFKRVKGIKKPSKEYPFAFYINSHHMAIYNEFITTDWKNNIFYKDYYEDTYRDLLFNNNDEITILCKKCNIDLYPTFEYFYNNRDIDKNSKLIMNASIGYFHKNHCPNLSHLAAVIIGRSVNNMLKRAEQLTKEGNTVELIATDSILWKGHSSNIVDKEKTMGAFILEHSNIKYCIRSKKCYQFIDNYNNLHTKFAGCNSDDILKYKFGDVLNLKTADIITKTYKRVGNYYEEV